MAKAYHTKFPVGTKVEDVDSHRRVVVVFIYENPNIACQLVAVQFDDREAPLACHVDDIRPMREGMKTRTHFTHRIDRWGRERTSSRTLPASLRGSVAAVAMAYSTHLFPLGS
jgi:hypothetical protein